MVFKSLAELARFSITYFLKDKEEPKVKPKQILKVWQEKGACFVTLKRGGKLRGCMGTVEAFQALYLDVVKNTISAAFGDPRFEPLTADELFDLEIEVSVLTGLRELKYENSGSLVSYLYEKRPGVMIVYGETRAVFIPKVWEEIKKAEEFLSYLCIKAGLSVDFWQVKRLKVFVFEERKLR